MSDDSVTRHNYMNIFEPISYSVYDSTSYIGRRCRRRLRWHACVRPASHSIYLNAMKFFSWNIKISISVYDNRFNIFCMIWCVILIVVIELSLPTISSITLYTNLRYTRINDDEILLPLIWIPCDKEKKLLICVIINSAGQHVIIFRYFIKCNNKWMRMKWWCPWFGWGVGWWLNDWLGEINHKKLWITCIHVYIKALKFRISFRAFNTIPSKSLRRMSERGWIVQTSEKSTTNKIIQPKYYT